MVAEDSISVIVPALNEARSIARTIATISSVLERRFKEFEILIFDDGSSDGTGESVEALARDQKHIRVFRHEKPKGLGGVFKEGLKAAAMNYVVRINGKNDITEENLDKILALTGSKDLVIPYMTNTNDRSLFRRSVSRLFTVLLNAIFGLRLHYYNHYVVCRKSLLETITIDTNSYAFQAEILIKLIKGGCSYVEVPVEDKFETGVGTKAFTFANAAGVAASFLRLAFQTCLKR